MGKKLLKNACRKKIEQGKWNLSKTWKCKQNGKDATGNNATLKKCMGKKTLKNACRKKIEQGKWNLSKTWKCKQNGKDATGNNATFKKCMGKKTLEKMHAGKKSSKENEIYQKPGNASKMEKMQQETMQPFKTCMGKKKPENMRAGKKSITEKKRFSKQCNLWKNAFWKNSHEGKIYKVWKMKIQTPGKNTTQCILSKKLHSAEKSQEKHHAGNERKTYIYESGNLGKPLKKTVIIENIKYGKWNVKTPGKTQHKTMHPIKKMHSAEKSQEKHDAGNEKWKDQWIKNWKHINMDHWVDVEIWTNTH